MNRRTAIKATAVAGAGTLVISKDFLTARQTVPRLSWGSAESREAR